MNVSTAFLAAVYIAHVVIGAGMIETSAPETVNRLELRPRPAPPKGAIDVLGFDVIAPWMDGFITLRFPEFLHSSIGQHFIDHYKPSDVAMYPLEPYPAWNKDLVTGAISYTYTDPTGLTFGGKATPTMDEVHLEFRVVNGTGKRISISPILCMTLTGSLQLNMQDDMENTHLILDGDIITPRRLTPTPEQKGRAPLYMINVKGGKPFVPLGEDFPPGGKVFWYADQQADLPLLFRATRDHNHLVAISFPNCTDYILYNGGIPCLHAGPTKSTDVDIGAEFVWRGVIYAMRNDSAELLRRYRTIEATLNTD